MAKKKNNKQNKNLFLFLIVAGLLLLVSVFAIQNKQSVGSKAAEGKGDQSKTGACLENCINKRCNQGLNCKTDKKQKEVLNYCAKFCGLPFTQQSKEGAAGKVIAPTPAAGKQSLPITQIGTTCFANGQYVARCPQGAYCKGDNDSARCTAIPAGKQGRGGGGAAGKAPTTGPTPKSK